MLTVKEIKDMYRGQYDHVHITPTSRLMQHNFSIRIHPSYATIRQS